MIPLMQDTHESVKIIKTESRLVVAKDGETAVSV